MVWGIAIGGAKLRETAEERRSRQKDSQKPVIEDVIYKCSRFTEIITPMFDCTANLQVLQPSSIKLNFPGAVP